METTAINNRDRSSFLGPTTPMKNSAEKSAKPGEESNDVSKNAILEAIQRLESPVNAQLRGFE